MREANPPRDPNRFGRVCCQYFGSKPKTNETYNYQLPNRITDSDTAPIFGERNDWQTGGWPLTRAGHSISGAICEFGTGIDPRDFGSIGGNYAYADGHVTWFTNASLESYYGYSYSTEIQILLPDNVW